MNNVFKFPKKKEVDIKVAYPNPKGRDEAIGGLERGEILSDDTRHEKLAETPYLQPDVTEDLEEILNKAGEKIGQTMQDIGDVISDSCDEAKKKISPYLETAVRESDCFFQKMRSLWDRFRGA